MAHSTHALLETEFSVLSVGCHPAGPGAQCDGEDWFAISSSPYLDYATVHVYERHMELLPRPNEGNPNWPDWIFCDFTCYVPWFRMYNQVWGFVGLSNEAPGGREVAVPPGYWEVAKPFPRLWLIWPVVLRYCAFRSL